MLQNFLSNAVRYTAEGSVAMAAAYRDGAVHISVTDTGPGIDAANHAEIFEEFRRLDTGVARGIGLGLAIVQRASRMLDHPLSLVSAPGEGSTFAVAAPLAAVGMRSAPSQSPADHRGIGARAVLVIDNEQAILDGMRAVLEAWGCRVVTAFGEAEACALSADDVADIDVILADYHLENGATGDQAVACVRQHLERPVPAIIVTADRTPELRERLIATGLHVLQKPVKPAQLRALLARLTVRRGAP